MKKLISAVLLSFVAFSSSAAWPTKEITIVVPYAVGGPGDVMGRIIAADLEKIFPVPVIVKSGQGGSQVVAMNQLLANENDNHTFLFSMDDMIYSNIALGNKNYEKFVGVNIFGTFYILMFGNSTSSTEKLKKQIANGTIINVGNAGFNGRNHLWSVNLTGLNVNAVSYKGVTPIVNDVLNGSLEYGLSNLSTFLPLVTEGKMQAVMVSSTKRLPHLPNVPTYLELGLRGDPLAGWLGYTARRDTSAEAIEKFGEAVRSVITPSNPKWQEYARRGIHLDNLGPRDANKFYETQIQDALKYKFLKHP